MNKKMNFEEKWNNSYNRNENHLFYPSDEVVKFLARNIRRKTGLNSYKDLDNNLNLKKIVCVGCGIGRHIKLCDEMGLDSYGTDLSSSAVDKAKLILKSNNQNYDISKIIQSNITKLPWKNNFFDYSISDSVLDSMPYKVAQRGINEIHRILKTDGIFYCSFISPLGTSLGENYDGEIIINDEFEKDTVQSYFNFEKIQNLLTPFFKIVSCELNSRQDFSGKNVGESRWHVVSIKNKL